MMKSPKSVDVIASKVDEMALVSRRNFLNLCGVAAVALPFRFNLAPDNAIASKWVIGGKGIVRNLEPDTTAGVRAVSLRNVETNYEWIVPGDSEFAFSAEQWKFEGLGPESGFRVVGEHKQESDPGRSELRLDLLNDEHQVKLSLFYTSFEGTSVIEQWARLENVGTKTIAGISRFDPIYFTLRGRPAELRCRTIHRGNYKLEDWPLEHSLDIHGGEPNRSARMGFLAVEKPEDDEILFIGIKWERDWVMSLKEDETKKGVQLNVGLRSFSHDLKPGTFLETPKVFLGVAHGDLDAACISMQRFLRKAVFPPALDRFPWVLYDFYLTVGGDIEKPILQEIDFAAELGVETFYYDASWYEGSAINGRGNWGAGLGRYSEDRRKFPRGIAYVSSYAHSKGLKFGLWVDPGVVDQELIPREIPQQWVAQHDGKNIDLQVTYRGERWAPLTKLCFGNPDVVAHVKDKLNGIINQFHLDWMKWDNSGLSQVACNREDHGHQAGDGSYAAMLGEYDIWNSIHKSHPNLVMEVCGGYSPQDFGKANSSRAHWLSDATFPSRHVRENVSTASYLFPSSCNAAYVRRERGGTEQKSDEMMDSKDAVFLDAAYRSRMMGLFGFGAYEVLENRVSLFPPEVLEAARRNIPTFKGYRHLLAEDCYHLTPPTGSDTGWQALEFCKEDGSEAVLFAFRNGSSQSAYRFKLRGLQLTARYSVTSVNQQQQTIQAARELIQDGAFIDLAQSEMSEILLLKRV
jgi:alpha-galactosidase